MEWNKAQHLENQNGAMCNYVWCRTVLKVKRGPSEPLPVRIPLHTHNEVRHVVHTMQNRLEAIE